MSPRPSANLAGFAAAQRRLRESFGQDIEFFLVADGEFASNVDIDPDSGKPFDPWATPIDGTAGETSVVVRANVVNRPLAKNSLGDDAEATAIGIVASDRIGVILNPEDYELVKTAVAFEVYGDRFKISDFRADGLGSLQRWVAYGAKT